VTPAWKSTAWVSVSQDVGTLILRIGGELDLASRDVVEAAVLTVIPTAYKVVAVDRDWFLGCGDDALRGRVCGGAVDVVAEDDEFVAAEPGDDVADARGVGEASGDGVQHPVAGFVSGGVVDGFEVVEVDEEQREARWHAAYVLA
jgi:hypothetical protein